jgi:hypothetical protein
MTKLCLTDGGAFIGGLVLSSGWFSGPASDIAP